MKVEEAAINQPLGMGLLKLFAGKSGGKKKAGYLGVHPT